MKFLILAVGKLKERFWVQACEEYLKRLRPYASVRVSEVADVDPSRAGGNAAALAAEAEAILRAVPESYHVVLLDIGGTQLSSPRFAQHLSELGLSGVSNICFIIGGSCGVDESVRVRADEKLSFGAITLPHNLARVVLLEQLYRSQKILRGEPYHK